MADLPIGTVTFLLTDVEGSVRLWEQHPVETRAALARAFAEGQAMTLEEAVECALAETAEL